MVKLIKCHIFYLFTKTNLKIFTITILFILIYLIFNVYSLNNSYINQKSLEFYYSSFQIIKIIMLFNFIFIFGYSFLRYNDNYRIIIINKNNNRIKYFMSKIIAISIILLSIYIIIFTLYLMITLFTFYNIEKIMLISFIDLLICCLYYGFISILLILIFDNLYMIFLIYIISLFNINNSILLFVLPIVKDNLILFSRLYYLILIFFIVIINIIIFHNKDL